MFNFKEIILSIVLVLLLNVNTANAAVIFEDNFDNRPDWQVPYVSTSQACSIEDTTCNVPDGYYGYYISPSVISPNTGHGLHLDGTNKKGNTGKGLTFWDQTDGYFYINGNQNWTSDALLAIEVPAQKEIYLHYWMKMQPGYSYLKGGGQTASMIRKLNHISHYLYNGKPYTFFADGGYKPTTINQMRRSNYNNSDIFNSLTIKPEPNYDGLQTIENINIKKGYSSTSGVWNYFDLPNDSLVIGNVSGTGTDYNSPGMFGDGNWHSFEFYLKNNSAPGVADGEYSFWLDGNIQVDASGFIFREAASTLGDNIWNMVHLGGNSFDPFLGIGVTGEQWYAIDDLVISNTYVGLDYVIGTSDLKAPAPPQQLNVL